MPFATPASAQDLTLINAIISAINLRLQTYPIAVGYLPLMTDGQYGQGFQLWQSIQSAVGNLASQAVNPIAPLGPFVQPDPIHPWTAGNITPQFLRLSGALTAAGYSKTSSWRRRRPKEVSVRTNLTDVFGNVAQPGDMAYILAELEAWGVFDGATWRSPTADDGPFEVDILDSEEGTMPTGLIQNGDYGDGYQIEQIVQVLNQLYITAMQPSFHARVTNVRANLAYEFSAIDWWDNIQSVFDEKWGTSGGGTINYNADDPDVAKFHQISWSADFNVDGGVGGGNSSPLAPITLGFNTAAVAGPNMGDGIGAVRMTADFSIQHSLYYQGGVPVPRKTDWYLLATNLNLGSTLPFVDDLGTHTFIFDANGDPVIENELVRWATSDYSTDNILTKAWPSAGTKPNDTHPTGFDGHHVFNQGYQMVNVMFAIQTWQFPIITLPST